MRDTPITDLTQLPLVLTLEEVCRVYRRSKFTVRRELQQKTFRPAPTMRFPYRWFRADIERDLQRRSVEQDNARRGGAVRGRRKRAS